MTVDPAWSQPILRTTADTPRALRAVRYLIRSTWLVLGVVAVYMVLPGSGVLRTAPRVAFMALAVAATLLLSSLPWARLADTKLGPRLLLAWVAADVVALSFGVALSGGTSSPFFILYSVVPIFLATAFAQRTQGAMLLLAYLSLLIAIATTGVDVNAKDLIIQMSVLGVATGIASVVTHELGEREKAHREASRESARRAELLAKIAAATRNISQLGPEEVLEAVVDAVVDLGFESSDLSVIDHDRHTCRVVAARALATHHLGSTHSARGGVTGRILETEKTVVVADYSSVPGAVPGVVDGPAQSVIGAPIWCDGQLSATLVAGFEMGRVLTPQEVETFELLADKAGHALSNARKFELERASVERLRELDQMKSEFIATVSHEIRTPLTAIAGIGSTLQLRWDELPEDVRKEFLSRLNSNATVLDGIISMLLDFSRVESGAVKPSFESVEIQELSASVLHRLAELLGDHNVVPRIGRGLWVHADYMLLDRVLENLVANACKHTPPGTMVLVRARRDGPDVEVAVEDDGPGIPPHELSRLGERFFRGGDVNSRRTRGTGLGLAFVAEVLKLHGTTLRVTSEVGTGSKFSFTLPLMGEPDRGADFRAKSAAN